MFFHIFLRSQHIPQLSSIVIPNVFFQDFSVWTCHLLWIIDETSCYESAESLEGASNFCSACFCLIHEQVHVQRQEKILQRSITSMTPPPTPITVRADSIWHPASVTSTYHLHNAPPHTPITVRADLPICQRCQIYTSAQTVIDLLWFGPGEP